MNKTLSATFLQKTLPRGALGELILNLLKMAEVELGDENALGIHLFFEGDNLSISTPLTRSQKMLPIVLDWVRDWKKMSVQKDMGPFFKSLGKKIKQRVIWDATCGTGMDTLFLLKFGAKVISFERNPILALLIKDAIRRANNDHLLGAKLKSDFKFIPIDGCDLERNDIILERPWIIYIDPMFPELPSNKKRALNKKEMRCLKEVVGMDIDSHFLFNWALRNALNRVVVKRPIRAKPISDFPHHSFMGKSIRFDVYFLTDNIRNPPHN
jgi:16S rRNA (guanine1516-N2)-methyltransferase